MVSHLLQSIPPVVVYLIVGLVIMVESLGIPVPGEIALVTAAVLATQHKAGLSPAWIAACASAGAIIGDSIGFLIGRRFGEPLFGRRGAARRELLAPHQPGEHPADVRVEDRVPLRESEAGDRGGGVGADAGQR